MDYEFRWNDWNLDHIAAHGIEWQDAEWIVRCARPPYPQEIGRGKYLVMGQRPDGAYLQVIYIIDPGGTVFVLHARPLTDRERRRFRRRKS
ncbi:MAG TPA: hypothetical protein VL992_09135 [Tepidisphaeraceae bacterium]|nr:hypothetical protein [Tepidisphaeraceae bacterium]